MRKTTPKNLIKLNFLAKIVSQKGIGFVSDYYGHSIYVEKEPPKSHRGIIRSTEYKINRINSEESALKDFIKLVNKIQIDRLSDDYVLNVQGLAFKVLEKALVKGYSDGALKLIKMLSGSGLQNESCQIENKEDLVKECLINLTRVYAKRSRLEGNKIYCEQAKLLMNNIYDGEFGDDVKGDEDFYRYLAKLYNHYMNTSNPEKFLFDEYPMVYLDLREKSDPLRIEENIERKL